jgi:hypothetical protein
MAAYSAYLGYLKSDLKTRLDSLLEYAKGHPHCDLWASAIAKILANTSKDRSVS